MYNYFITEGHEIAFYLLQLDGAAKMDRLGVTMAHYTTKKVADRFYNDKLTKLNMLEDASLKESAIESLELLMKEIRG